MRHSSKSKFNTKSSENSVFYFSGRSISSRQKRTATQLFENCAADLLLDDFHAPGGHIKKDIGSTAQPTYAQLDKETERAYARSEKALLKPDDFPTSPLIKDVQRPIFSATMYI